MEQFMYLLKGYGVPFLVMGLVCIFIVGLIKTFGAFKKCNKQVKTIVLFVIDALYCFAVIPLYFKYANITFTAPAYLSAVATLDGCVLSMYSVYEALGVKKLTSSVLLLLADAFKEMAQQRKDAKEKKAYETLEATARLVAKFMLEEEQAELNGTVVAVENTVEQEATEKRSDTALHR